MNKEELKLELIHRLAVADPKDSGKIAKMLTELEIDN